MQNNFSFWSSLAHSSYSVFFFTLIYFLHEQQQKNCHENLPELHIFRMLKEICRIYNIGSLPIHTLKSYPLQRSLAYTNYYTLTSQKVIESHSCMTGMKFSVLPTFKILYLPIQDVNILCPEAKCVQKQTGY